MHTFTYFVTFVSNKINKQVAWGKVFVWSSVKCKQRTEKKYPVKAYEPNCLKQLTV